MSRIIHQITVSFSIFCKYLNIYLFYKSNKNKGTIIKIQYFYQKYKKYFISIERNIHN